MGYRRTHWLAVFVVVALGCSKPAQQAAPPAAEAPAEPASEAAASGGNPQDAVVELTNAALVRGAGGNKVFSVDYRFTQGEPWSIGTYRLVITAEDGSGREVVMTGMAPTGTIKDEFLDPKDLVGSTPKGLYTARLEFDQGPSAKVISNEVTAGTPSSP